MLRRNTKLLALVLCFVMLFSLIALTVYEPFKVKLNMYERVVCMSLFPKEGTFVTLKIVRDMQNELAPSEEEAKLAGLQDLPGGGVKAENWFIVIEKEIVFGDIALGLVVDALEKLDEEEKLTNDHFTLYEKFMIDPKKKEDEKKEGD